MKISITEEEALEIGNLISRYHKVFYTFWEMSSIYFTDDIKTAAVKLEKNKKPELIINIDFWKNLTTLERIFLICHECLHIILDHGIRNGKDIPNSSRELINKAQDITINEMIVTLFDYNREDFREWEKYCWIDTCFENSILIAKNETFIYYLKKLIENKNNDKSENQEVFDEHSEYDDSDDSNSCGENIDKNDNGDHLNDQSDIDYLAKTLAEELSESELESIKKSLPDEIKSKGSQNSFLEHILNKKKKKSKIKFKNIVKGIKKNAYKKTEVDIETFSRDDRRFYNICEVSNTILPGKCEYLLQKRDRILTSVFMDVSGSCIDYISTFEKIFYILNEEKEIFDLRTFIFDVTVREVKSEDKIFIGGGTSFKIIEDECIKIEQETKKYPDCVIVITDGYGDKVTPKFDSRWIWMLTDKDSNKSFISSRSKAFYIKDIIF